MLTNAEFNKKIKTIFNRTSSDSKLIELAGYIALNFNLTQKQYELIDELIEDASNGLASCPERYFSDRHQ